MIIRQLLPDDWVAFRALRIAALTDAPDAYSSTLAETLELSEADLRDLLTERTQFVARSPTGAVLGTAGAYPDEDGVELIGMWIAPAARRSGVARALIARVIAWSRAAGYPSLLLWVTDTNAPAIALYTSLGFTPTGARQLVRPDAPHHELAMSLPL